jgi:ribosome biogenesis protein BRX1
VRSEVRRAKAGRHKLRVEQQMDKLTRKKQLGFREDGGKREKKDALDSRTLFS